MSLKGFIFDFDGLILDTEVPGYMAWKEIFNRYHLPFTHEHWKKAIGTGPTAYDPAADLSTLVQASLDPAQLREEQITRANILIQEYPILPGVLDFIKQAKLAGKRLAVASSSPRSWVIGHLSRLDLIKYFDFILTADDVTDVKPSPELFQLALSRLGLLPSEVIVFEDSPSGISAANAAGIYCIAVPNDITRTMSIVHADQVANSFLEIDLDHLISRFILV